MDTPYCTLPTNRTLNLPGGGLEPVTLAGQPVTRNIALDAGEGVTIVVAILSGASTDGEVILATPSGKRWVIPIAFFVSPLRVVPPEPILTISFNATAAGHAIFVRDGDMPQDKDSFTPGD